MLRGVLITLFAMGALSGIAIAENHISEWSGAQGGYEITQYNNSILITAPGTYKFQAMDGDSFGQIVSIKVASDVVGVVDVSVRRNPNDPNGPPYDPNDAATWCGAWTVGTIGFASASPPPNLILNIAELRILDRLGPEPTDPPSRATAVTGVCDILAVNKDITIQRLAGGTFHTVYLAANLNLTDPGETGQHAGNISIESFTAPYAISIVGNFPGTLHVGECGCGAPMSGAISISGDAGPIGMHTSVPGTIDIGDDLLGPLAISGALEGQVHIQGGIVGDGGRVHVGTDVSGVLWIEGDVQSDNDPRITLGDTEPLYKAGVVGSILIDGVLNGGVWIEGDIHAGGDLTLTNGMGSAGSVEIEGSIAGDFETTLGDGCYANVEVGGDIAQNGSLQVASAADLTAQIEIEGDVVGHVTLDVGGSLAGQVSITGSIAEDATVSVSTDVGLVGQVEVVTDVIGTLAVAGPVSSHTEFPRIKVDGDVSGLVSVQGGPSAGLAGGLQVGGDIAPQGALVVGGPSGVTGWLRVIGDIEAGGSVEIQGPGVTGQVRVGALAGTRRMTGVHGPK